MIVMVGGKEVGWNGVNVFSVNKTLDKGKNFNCY